MRRRIGCSRTGCGPAYPAYAQALEPRYSLHAAKATSNDLQALEPVHEGAVPPAPTGHQPGPADIYGETARRLPLSVGRRHRGRRRISRRRRRR